MIRIGKKFNVKTEWNECFLEEILYLINHKQYKLSISVQSNGEVIFMGKKMKADNERKKKHVSHNPQDESVRAVFGEPKAKTYDPTDFKIQNTLIITNNRIAIKT